MHILIILVVIILAIFGFSVYNNSPDTDETDEAVVVEEAQPEPQPTPKAEPVLPSKEVRVTRGNFLAWCEKVSDHALILPSPYGERPIHGVAKAKQNDWCIWPENGDILYVSDDKWSVYHNPVAENWPDGFPILVKVYTEDGRAWRARADSYKQMPFR